MAEYLRAFSKWASESYQQGKEYAKEKAEEVEEYAEEKVEEVEEKLEEVKGDVTEAYQEVKKDATETYEDAAETYGEVKAKYDDVKKKAGEVWDGAIDQQNKMQQNVNQKVVNYARDHGVISQDTADTIMKIDKVGQGMKEAAGDLVLGLVKDVVIPTNIVSEVVKGVDQAKTAAAAYESAGGGFDGVVEAFNQVVNPARPAIVAGVRTYEAIQNEEWKEAGKQGVNTAVGTAATVGVAMGIAGGITKAIAGKAPPTQPSPGAPPAVETPPVEVPVESAPSVPPPSVEPPALRRPGPITERSPGGPPSSGQAVTEPTPSSGSAPTAPRTRPMPSESIPSSQIEPVPSASDLPTRRYTPPEPTGPKPAYQGAPEPIPKGPETLPSEGVKTQRYPEPSGQVRVEPASDGPGFEKFPPVLERTRGGARMHVDVATDPVAPTQRAPQLPPQALPEPPPPQTMRSNPGIVEAPPPSDAAPTLRRVEVTEAAPASQPTPAAAQGPGFASETNMVEPGQPTAKMANPANSSSPPAGGSPPSSAGS